MLISCHVLFTNVNVKYSVYICIHMKAETKTIGVRVTRAELLRIHMEIELGNATNVSDYLHQALREKIARAESS